MNYATVAEAKQARDALQDGADIQQDFGPQFFSPGFGALKDQFRIRWQINVPQQEN